MIPRARHSGATCGSISRRSLAAAAPWRHQICGSRCAPAAIPLPQRDVWRSFLPRRPTPRLIPRPIPPDSVGVPLSFNDPVYANVTSGTINIALPPDSSRTGLSIIENSGVRRLPALAPTASRRFAFSHEKVFAASAVISI